MTRTWFLLVVAMLSCQCAAQTCGHLTEFYHATNGAEWNKTCTDVKNLATCWLNGTDCCQWFGVSCTNSQVSLNLNDNSLTGTLPASMGLMNLGTLELMRNTVSGHLPDINAVNILLGINRISGSVPEAVLMGNRIDLRSNLFSGTLPPVVVPNATQLFVSLNKISGSVSPLLWDSPHLQIFDGHSNRFGGHLPPIRDAASAITSISLNDNAISGTLPDFPPLAHLLRLFYGDTKISGHFPDSLGSLQLLNQFDISGAQLSGTLPLAYGNMVSLARFRVDRNKLSGTLPEWENITSLVLLSTSSNRLSGTIPVTLAYNQELVSVNLGANYFSGGYPAFLHRWVPLYSIDISYNLLSGPIPDTLFSIGRASNIAYVNVLNNPLRSDLTFNQTIYEIRHDLPAQLFLPRVLCNAVGVKETPNLAIRISPEYFDWTTCYCSRGYYGIPPECQECPAYGDCTHGDGLLRWKRGFYPATSSTPDTDKMQYGAYRNKYVVAIERCPDAVNKNEEATSSCNPKGTCVAEWGGGIFNADCLCEEGRLERMCSLCGREFFRSGSLCLPCTGTHSWRTTLVLIVLVLVGAGFMVIPSAATHKLLIVEGLVVIVLLAFAVSEWWLLDALALLVVCHVATLHRVEPSSSKPFILYAQVAWPLLSSSSWSESFHSGSRMDILSFRATGIECLFPELFVPKQHRASYHHLLATLLLPLAMAAAMVMLFAVRFLVVQLRRICERMREDASKDTNEEDMQAAFLLNEDENAKESTKLHHQDWKVAGTALWVQFNRAIVFLFYFCYFDMTRVCLGALRCDPENGTGTLYQYSAPWVRCDSPEHSHVVVLAWSGLLCYSVGFPAICGVLLYLSQQRPHSVAAASTAFLHKDYRAGQRYFEVWWMLRRVVLAIAFSLLVDNVLQPMVVLLVIGTSIATQFLLNPFATAKGDRLEILALVGIFITYFPNESLELDQFRRGSLDKVYTNEDRTSVSIVLVLTLAGNALLVATFAYLMFQEKLLDVYRYCRGMPMDNVREVQQPTRRWSSVVSVSAPEDDEPSVQY